MGQPITATAFSDQEFADFRERLRAETALLAQWFADDTFDRGEPTAGFELECWLVGPDLAPTPRVEEILARVDNPQVVPELATFIVEINGSPAPLRGDALSRLAVGLNATLQQCAAVAAGFDARVALIGILPTVTPANLTVASMTARARYRALNDRILALRHERPLRLRIAGREQLELEWQDVMLEAAATSFQVHLKVPPQAAARVYNASKILSGPLVAIGANSPYLFGRDLWDETRITLFEQAVSLGGPILEERVSFGFGYAQASIMETFQANLDRYPVLLPQCLDAPPEQLAHLRLHNGTIWRWNRPLIGFDDAWRPHLRIEHRVLPAGPTVADCLANAALYLGAVSDLAQDPTPPEQRLHFAATRAGFYACAREGLAARIPWMDGHDRPVSDILTQDLLPRARRGLAAVGADRGEIEHWLGIIDARLERPRTGADWQRAWVERHGADMRGLVAAYLEHQRGGQPVHTWTLD
jgi:gamma-glutamyl:cysteine ligase YbdK (ATP-grasp superfamily)